MRAGDNGLAAIDAGVVFFIDRQLYASYGPTGRWYDRWPYVMGASTQGDQSALAMHDRYRLGIQGISDYAQQLFQRRLAQLAEDQRDRIRTDTQAGVPNTFDGNSIQASTTCPADTGTCLASRGVSRFYKSFPEEQNLAGHWGRLASAATATVPATGRSSRA
jgi:hypothetical protein